MTDIPADIDQLSPCDLAKLLKDNKHLQESVIDDLFRRLSDILILEPNVHYLSSPIIVCGDIHGQLLDLFQLFKKAGDDFTSEGVSCDKTLKNTYLFMGDYVDRGYCSIETFAFLALLKVKYPQQIYLLRGNHESRQINQIYGLFNDCMLLYGHSGIWFLLNDVFDLLPISAVVDNKIFCVHGGLSPKINFIGQISTIYRRKEIESGPIADLTWSDPDDVSKFVPNRRGNGFIFGKNQTLSFLYNNGLLARNYSYDGDKKNDVNHGFIARSHQLANAGFQWFHDDNLVIVWSAPNYMYKSGNDATFMRVTKEAAPEFVKFDKDEKSDVKPEDITIDYFA
ncbi:Serine/threonine-protein phosphatase PP-X isozyme 1 [Tritrichomonas foetus]|uniref:Serine/threonine-protein phosphatase n=1 Tax=Tritrichomonas foetus TaxID=1144522 RepID=A0A1J4L1G2_9EUKA|nr:Serine/threonine-protein phosphatase PP-X isozyme 1 [Tritrichomonas foetus]|eukprot:OHT15798.1 Serine/threonine-protein phosphatase PP-X isozyme 1 [Tritrichomonas foetus]